MEEVVLAVGGQLTHTLLEEQLDRIDLRRFLCWSEADELTERQTIQAVRPGIEESGCDQPGDLIVVLDAGADRRQFQRLLKRSQKLLALLEGKRDERTQDTLVIALVITLLTACTSGQFTGPCDALGIGTRLGSGVVDRIPRFVREAHELSDRRLPRPDPRSVLRVRLETNAHLAIADLHDGVRGAHAQHVLDPVHVAECDFGHGTKVVDEAADECSGTTAAHAPVVCIEFGQLPDEHHRPELLRRHLLRTDHDERLVEDERSVPDTTRDRVGGQLGVGLHELDDHALKQVSRFVHVDADDEGKHIDQVPRKEGEVPTPGSESTVGNRNDGRTAVERTDEDRQHNVTDRNVDRRNELLDLIVRPDLIELEVARQREKEIGLDDRPHQLEGILQLGVERLPETRGPHLHSGENRCQFVADQLQGTLIELSGGSLGVTLLQTSHHQGQCAHHLLLRRVELVSERIGDFPVFARQEWLVLAQGLEVGGEEGVDGLREEPVHHDVGQVVRDAPLVRNDLPGRVRLHEVDHARHREDARVELTQHPQVDAETLLGLSHIAELKIGRVGLSERASDERVGGRERVVLPATTDEESRAPKQPLLSALGMLEVVEVRGNEFEDGLFAACEDGQIRFHRSG